MSLSQGLVRIGNRFSVNHYRIGLMLLLITAITNGVVGKTNICAMGGGGKGQGMDLGGRECGAVRCGAVRCGPLVVFEEVLLLVLLS